MIVPVIQSMLRTPDANVPTVLEGALDLANTLMDPGMPFESLTKVHRHLSDLVLALLNAHDDPAVLQSCCEYLRCATSLEAAFQKEARLVLRLMARYIFCPCHSDQKAMRHLHIVLSSVLQTLCQADGRDAFK